MRVAVDRAIALSRASGPKTVLVVFDIDSTLLRGAVQEPDLSAVEDSDPDRARAIERAVMYLKPLVPTEAGLVDQLARLHQAGIATYALTARGVNMRDMTLRELAANHIGFPDAPECGPPLCVVRGVIPRGAVLAATKTALGQPELERLGFAKGRQVSVSNGVMMASGLDKGVMLRTLIASLPRAIEAVIFVDDAEHNVAAVSRASAAMPQQVAIFQYHAPSPLPLSSKQDATRLWQRADEAICTALDPRWCAPSPRAQRRSK